MDNACEKNVESRPCEQQLEQLSPFELKNTLINLAKKEAQVSTATFLNAGRGNPNWVASTPRDAFFLLGQFAMNEARRVKTDGSNRAIGVESSPVEEGVAARFDKFLDEHKGEPAAELMRGGVDYLVGKGANADDVVFEWVDGIMGDHYPTPDRILKYTEILVQDYLAKEMGNDDKSGMVYDLFATEGGTAGMCYAFDSVQENKLIRKGEKMALMVPAFTPYITIPHLDRFDFEVVKISANAVEADGYHYWQYPDEEIDKLRDPSIKLLCLINPSNPPSYALSEHSRQRLIDVVKNDNPNLMIVTDDVYGTFVKDFRSLMYDLPNNTMCVYSFSKFFGATGWRLAVIAINKDNVFDRMIAKLPDADKADLKKRYGDLTLDVDKLKFIDRMVADSRLVGLNHTAGLSTPQQIQMSFFALRCLLDKESVYRSHMQKIITERLDALWSTTGFTLLPDPLRAGYYSEIDIMVWAKKFYGQEFADYLNANYEPVDFVIRMANETAVVLLNGDGFDGPAWSVRASLANLNMDDYLKIGTEVRKLLDEYHARYLAQKA